MKNQLIAKIRTIADSEKFKQDAFFLCGAATGHPNQNLLTACEAYIKTVEDNKPNEAEVNELIKELEAVIAAGEEIRGSNTIVINRDYINEIIINKDVLLNE